MNPFQHEIHLILLKNAQKTQHLYPRYQLVNVIEGNNYYLLQELFETSEYTTDKIEFIMLKQMVHTVIIVFEV
jgi:hypothetical protein